MRKIVKALLAGVIICSGHFVQGQDLDRKALGGLLQRVMKDKAGSFEIEYIAPEKGKDVFEVGAGRVPGHIVLRGSNGVSVASALNYYLKEYCHCLITWNGVNMRLPAVLPTPGIVHKVTPYTYRYYLNYCTYQYSMAWWDWDRWQKEIDWMAMNGINLPLALTGEEGIWQKVYRSMGFTDKELDQFYTGPAFFSWLWMGNIDAWGGPLPAHWKESHVVLQKKILAAERAFGMKAVLPAFTGHVPPAFKDRFPQAKVKKTNWDAGFPDVYILDPGDPLFVEIGRKYIAAQTEEFGTDHFYSADTFNENVPPTSDSSYLDEMSKKVFASMAAADKKAVWVMQGWMFHYNASFWKPAQIQGLLKAVPDDHMIVLDLYSESHPMWNKTDAYYGKPWIWNMLHNFGGNISLWGRMSHVAEDPSAALHDPSAGKMMGIGLTPEGIEQNPALYHLMLENVWQDGPVKLDDWLKRWALARYGAADEHIDRAWRLLEGSVYRGGPGEGGNESIIVARPTFEKTIDRVLTKLDYDPKQLVSAWELFVQAAPKFRENDGFRYDLVDITRQVLANYASPLQQQWVAAYRAKDTAAYRRYSRQFLALLDDMDRLLATRKDFLLGKWIADARANGMTAAEKDLYEKNARNLVTLWGDKESILREYSCRQWSGLIKGFYKPRWELFFRYLDMALVSGGEVDLAAFDREVKNQEWTWVNSRKEQYASVPSGDAVAVALEMFNKYSVPERSNDHIFPAAVAARKSIDFDASGFIVNGKKTFLVSAGLEYARVPRALWQDRLLRLKRAGFNCVEIYTFWNWHEEKDGVFNFSGDHDLDAFLKLCKSMDLYVIARVGPYYCAEWDNGGYPLWLRFKDGVKVREENTAFMGYVDRFFEHLMPIVVNNQINRGGSVIMVQLENEHNLGWGTYEPNGYFRHLREKAVSLGMEVPYFFSGLHHASDPVGETLVLDDARRPNPWFSTEFWSVWYNFYGSSLKDALEYERRTWKIISRGGGGYNYYMAYGGTNFGYTNNDEDAACYDYGAAVGQAGDLRPIYYSFKRMGWFARSFESVLSSARDGGDRYRGDSVGARVRVSSRVSAVGDIEFFDNLSDSVAGVRCSHGSSSVRLRLAPKEIFPVIHDLVLSPSIKVEWAPVRVFGIQGSSVRKTMVLYGETGEEARVEFSVKGAVVVEKGNAGVGKGNGVSVVGGKVKLNAAVPAAGYSEYLIRVGAERLRILVMNKTAVDRTWFVDGEVVTGADYVGDGVVERPLMKSDSLVLAPWVAHTAAEPSTVDFDDASWKASEWPLQMGADGDLSPNAWYRTVVEASVDGDYVLQIEGGDRGTVFVDGVLAATVKLHEGEVALKLTKGRHVLAVFTAHDGRDKLVSFLGDMSTVDMKGVTGKPRLELGLPSSQELKGWKFLKAGDKGDVNGVLPKGTEAGWVEYEIGKDAFALKEGYGWFRVELPAPPSGASKGMLKFRSVDENATVFINGRRMAHHEGWNLPFAIALEGLDTMAKPIVMTVFMENYSNEGGIDRPVRVNYFQNAIEVKGWKMKGGITEPGAIASWVPLGKMKPGMPRYYKTSFTLPAYGETGEHVIWRVHTGMLGHGSVWVNGHNLGRYPEKVPAPGLYIPECWLQAGGNELVVYDEDGQAPGLVEVKSEPAASRWIEKDVKKKISRDRIDGYSYVDPFIGTARSIVNTRWGNEGGTYPGAVAPWGFMQLSPETREGKGYDHGDSVIRYFSCAHHPSGYPNGSSGDVRVMPGETWRGRSFRHVDEYAKPGYYRVKFRDPSGDGRGDGTVVEATASARVGVFRFSFPAGVRPAVRMVWDERVPVAIKANTPYKKEGDLLLFEGARVVELAVAVSPFSIEDARVRLSSAEIGFDRVRKETERVWRDRLSVVAIEDGKEEAKKIFYTALYHSMLLPWMEGTADDASYGSFSPWDTFRTLHPLLCLLFPDRQQAMVASLLARGVPTGPMTGNHGVPVIVDSWLKGIHVGDSGQVYSLLRKGVVDEPYTHRDRGGYVDRGYVSLRHPESVTRTVEYAFDDWALSAFAGAVMGRSSDAALLGKRSYQYRNLFDAEEMFMLPRDEDGTFRKRPGTSGYKEGDAWVYSYFTPQHPKDLVALMGGEKAFAARLDSALRREDIVFDNETVFHIPYFFNYAGDPAKTEDWLRTIRDGRFSAKPGGLPGNDDMGSMSSWWVFSAMGLYPFCPGRPEYDLGTPLFGAVTVQLGGGRSLSIKRVGMGRYVQEVKWNGVRVKGLQVSHAALISGGVLEFVMGDRARVADVREENLFVIKDVKPEKVSVRPGEEFGVRFMMGNGGPMGTRLVRLSAAGRGSVGQVNCLLDSGESKSFLVKGRLFAYGKVRLTVNDVDAGEVDILNNGDAVVPVVSGLSVKPLLKEGARQELQYNIQNYGGERGKMGVAVSVNDLSWIDTMRLGPGEKGSLKRVLEPQRVGRYVVEAGDAKAIYKVYRAPEESLLLALSADGVDHSGFEHISHVVTGEDPYIEVENSPSLDQMGNTITMMAWVFPEKPGESLVDIFSKGDYHVLQVADNKSLTFFAGGWGRGDCTVPLPADWFGHWHHIAGVCTGGILRVYIDGVLKGSASADGVVNLSVENNWVLGRNEEFPGQRAFHGKMDDARVYAEPLSDKDILAIFKKRSL